jgi:hypothetical protein
LFAEDTATPYDPFAEDDAPGANTLIIAGAACQVPAFWFFCFEPGNVTQIDSGEGIIPELVSDIAQVRSRLAVREVHVRELFPGHVPAWQQFRKAVESADRRYLKLDAYEIWMMQEDDRKYGRQLMKALKWFDFGRKAELDALFWLAEIKGYDRRTKTFRVEEDECPERFLFGWLENE